MKRLIIGSFGMFGIVGDCMDVIEDDDNVKNYVRRLDVYKDRVIDDDNNCDEIVVIEDRFWIDIDSLKDCVIKMKIDDVMGKGKDCVKGIKWNDENFEVVDEDDLDGSELYLGYDEFGDVEYLYVVD